MSSAQTTPTPEQWRRIEALFHDVVDLDGAERHAYLARECDDATLREQVEALVHSSTTERGEIGRVIGAVAGEIAETMGRDRGGLLEGERVGPYRLLRPLGHGGMGSVYLAERADRQYRQKVAIKLITPGALSQETLQRFRSERQILATLEHPNIARLLDGGETDRGLPYLVMEYVRGQPITEYCDEQRLSTRRRLQMFRTVCAAVHFAHRNLIVHRDLKPTNILVADDGSPKLLDFGIAKLLGGDAAQQTVAVTAADVRLMTPTYASPEQVRGEPITTASDVYALGVLLYELLAGVPPFRFGRVTPAYIEQAICETVPRPPSEAPAQSGDRRSRRARRELRGDLDNIVLMALRKEPERRYGSVEQLSEDLRRYLQRLPVLARADTVTYRAARYLQRHRVGVAVAAVVAAVIASLVGFYTLRLTAERDRAQLAAERAEQVAQFLTGIFELPDPGEALGETITAREILASGAGRARTELADQPGVQARLLGTIGGVYNSMGLFDDAAQMLEQALALERAVHAGNHEDVVTALMRLGIARYNLGEFDLAIASLAEAADMAGRTYEAGDPRLADVVSEHGHALHAAGDYDAAKARYRRAAAIYESRPGHETSVGYSNVLSNLAQVTELLGDFDTSLALYRRVREIHRRILPPEHPDYLTTLHNLAVSLQQQRYFDEAEVLHREVIEIESRVLGPEHPDLGSALVNLGRLLHEKGDLDGAEPYLRRGLEFSLRRGEDHPFVGYDKANLAALLTDRQQYAEARPLFEEALALYDRVLDADHPYIASAGVAYARLLLAVGETAFAERRARAALAICDAALPDDHWLAAAARSVLGEALTVRHDFEAAEPLLVEAYPVLAASRGGEDMRTQRALQRLVDHYALRGDGHAAARYRALQVR